MNNLQHKLVKNATLARKYLETIWPIWHESRNIMPDVQSQGTCGRSSLFVQRVLKECGIESQWVTGGNNCGKEFSGFYANGKFHNHSWLEVNQTWVVDVTADQFNEAPILVVPNTDPRYKKGQYDCANPESIANRLLAVDNIWNDWIAFNHHYT